MDPTQQLLAIVSVLAVVLVGLTIVVVFILRTQQKAQKQAARRAVEQEQKQERNRLQTLVARVDPLARKAEGDEIIAAARAEAERVRTEAERARSEADSAVRVERRERSTNCWARLNAASVGWRSAKTSTPACNASSTSGSARPWRSRWPTSTPAAAISMKPRRTSGTNSAASPA